MRVRAIFVAATLVLASAAATSAVAGSAGRAAAADVDATTTGLGQAVVQSQTKPWKASCQFDGGVENCLGGIFSRPHFTTGSGPNQTVVVRVTVQYKTSSGDPAGLGATIAPVGGSNVPMSPGHGGYSLAPSTNRSTTTATWVATELSPSTEYEVTLSGASHRKTERDSMLTVFSTVVEVSVTHN